MSASPGVEEDLQPSQQDFDNLEKLLPSLAPSQQDFNNFEKLLPSLPPTKQPPRKSGVSTASHCWFVVMFIGLPCLYVELNEYNMSRCMRTVVAVCRKRHIDVQSTYRICIYV